MKKQGKQFKFKALYTSLRFYIVVPIFLIIFLLTGLKGFGQSPIPDIKEVAVWSNSPVKVGEALAFHATGGTVYSWTGPNNFTSNEQFNQINPADTLNSGTYTVDI